MKINLLSAQKVKTLSAKGNQRIIEKYIVDNPTNAWLADFFEDENLFTQSKIELPEINLDMSAEDPVDTDYQNAIKIFEGLNHISESTACDERLWISCSFGQFYEYMRYRFNPQDDRYNLQTRWIMSDEGKKRDLFKHGISSLWWYAYITYDEKRENPYELLDYCFKHRSFLYALYYRAYSSSKTVCHAVIQAMMNYENVGGTVTHTNIHEIMKYVSFLGGAYLIDTFSEQELCDKILLELIRMEEELTAEKLTKFKLNE